MIMDTDALKQIISQEMSGIGYSEWSQETYAKVLAFLEDYGIPYDKIYKDNNKVWTLLWNEKGEFIDFRSC